MAVNGNKLKARLDDWQAYQEQTQASMQLVPRDTNVELFAWDSPTEQVRKPEDGGWATASEVMMTTEVVHGLTQRYESQIAEVNAQLECERLKAQQLAEKLAQEVIRSRQPRQEIPPLEPLVEQKIYREPKVKTPVHVEELTKQRDLRSVQLLIIVLVIAVFCSLLAFTVSR